MANKYFPQNLVEVLVSWIKEKFVQKDGTKVLSDNNYTKDDMNKVRAIPEDPKYTDTTYDLTPYQKTVDADIKYATKEEVMGVDVSGLLKNYEQKKDKGTAGGYAGLDSNAKVPVAQLPDEALKDYTHPESHPATMITEDSTHRFVTDGEKTTWNKKQDKLTAGANINIGTDGTISATNTVYDDKDIKARISTLENKEDKDTTYSPATSTTDGLLTSADFKKLSGIETGAQVNKIETIKKNGVIVNADGKAVDISVPTKMSELNNDKSFQTKTEVQALIQQAGHMEKKIVESKPTTGLDNILYLVPKDGGADNVYEEWLWIDSKWEKIGDTATKIDLTGHWAKNELEAMTKEELDEILEI